MFLARRTVTWVFDASINCWSLRALLATLSPLQKHVTRGFSIASTSLGVSCPCASHWWQPWNDGPPPGYQGPCLRDLDFFDDILATSGLSHLYELTIRVGHNHTVRIRDKEYKRSEFLSRLIDGTVADGTVVSPYWADNVEHWIGLNKEFLNLGPHPARFLDFEFRLFLWKPSIARSIHNHLIGGRVTRVRFQYDEVFEEMRPFFVRPAERLFGRFQDYLTPDEVKQWDVTLDWPVGAKTLFICVTKQKASQAVSEPQVGMEDAKE